MPVRSQGQLLAGLAALLGLCTAGAGCQLIAVDRNAFTMQCPDGSCGGGGGAGASLGTAVASRANPTPGSGTPHRPLFSSTQEPALARNCDCGASGAFAIRPTPASSGTSVVASVKAVGNGTGAVASAWQPVQRLEGDVTPVSGLGNGVEMERPQPTPSLVPTGASIEQPIAPAISTTEATQTFSADRAFERPAEKPPERAPERMDRVPEQTPARAPEKTADRGQARGEQTLPAPRAVRRNGNGNGNATGQALVKQQGYPDLPPPLVTHGSEVPREFAKRALSAYIVEPPDILIIRASPNVTFETFPLDGQHLVRPDGTINLGPYGDVYVAGLSLNAAKDAVAGVLRNVVYKNKAKEERFTLEEIRRELQVDVSVYNSKFYYVITDGGGYGEQVFKIPSTGNETVLDALAAIQGLPAQASKKKIWLARATPMDQHQQPFILPIDWCSIAQRGSAVTNYQVFPGDRIYVQSDPLLRFDTRLQRVLSPIERLFGITLLGSSTVNSIRNGNSGSNGTNGIGTGR